MQILRSPTNRVTIGRMQYPNIPTFDPRLLSTGTDSVSVVGSGRERGRPGSM